MIRLNMSLVTTGHSRSRSRKYRSRSRRRSSRRRSRRRSQYAGHLSVPKIPKTPQGQNLVKSFASINTDINAAIKAVDQFRSGRPTPNNSLILITSPTCPYCREVEAKLSELTRLLHNPQIYHISVTDQADKLNHLSEKINHPLRSVPLLVRLYDDNKISHVVGNKSLAELVEALSRPSN